MSTISNKSPEEPDSFGRKPRKWIPRIVVAACLLGVLGLLFVAGNKSTGGNQKGVWTNIYATSVITAVDSYRSEYGGMPIPEGVTPAEGGSEFVTDQPEGVALLRLLADENPRRLPLLRVREGRNRKDGVRYDKSGSVTALHDPWGNPYHIILDTKGDGVLVAKRGKKTETIRGRKCIVFSAGKDRKLGTRDDYRSW